MSVDDEQLIKALGWQPCQWTSVEFRGGQRVDCATHGVRALDTTHPPSCVVMADRLADIRTGIDLARDGIAAGLHDLAGQARGTSGVDGRTHHDSCWLSHVDCALLRAAAAARGWQP